MELSVELLEEEMRKVGGQGGTYTSCMLELKSVQRACFKFGER